MQLVDGLQHLLLQPLLQWDRRRQAAVAAAGAARLLLVHVPTRCIPLCMAWWCQQLIEFLGAVLIQSQPL
jgi:hypothetical protein